MNIAELRQKAESGNVAAQSVLGICYLDGIDVQVDYAQAFRLLSSAANRGSPRAATALARMYAEALGVPQNLREAVRLYEFAARAGEFLAQIELGRIYSRGPEEFIDPHAALRWYSTAVAQERNVANCDKEIQEAKQYLKGAG